MTNRASSVTNISFSPDGLPMIWLSSDANLRFWDGRTVSSALQLPSGRLISFGNSAIAVSDERKPVIRFVDQFHMCITSVAGRENKGSGIVIALTPPVASPSHRNNAHYNGYYALLQEQSVIVHSYAGESIGTCRAPNVTFCATFSPDCSKLAMGDNRGGITVIDLTQKTFTTWRISAHKSFTCSLAYSSDGSILVSGGWDGLVKVHDAVKGIKSIATIRYKGRGADKIHAVDVSHNDEGMLIAAVGNSGTIKIWLSRRDRNHRVNPIVIASYETNSNVHALAFSKDTRHLASGSGNGTVRLFGVPSKPLLVSKRPDQESSEVQSSEPWKSSTKPHSSEYILTGQLADRRLIFCPSQSNSLTCSICMQTYNATDRVPICSGSCGHTFSCRSCNDRLWEHARDAAPPQCPVCSAILLDIAPDFELLHTLCAHPLQEQLIRNGSGAGAASFQNPQASPLSSPRDYIDLKRLQWSELPETEYMRSHSCTVFSGTMDGEVVGIRIPSPEISHLQSDEALGQLSETERHVRCLRRLRGPHIIQLYGLSRTSSPDNRIVVVSELPSGGTLAQNLLELRESGVFAPTETALAISLQLVRTVMFLHQSDVCAGWAISPQTIALGMPIHKDWSVVQRLKIIEMGGTLFKSECTVDIPRKFPSDFTRYMAPEMLDEDRSEYGRREIMFRKMCQADMYSLGVVLWEVCTGKKPFEGFRPAQVIAAVVGRGERPGYPPSTVPEKLRELILRLWAQDPHERPSALEAHSLLETIPTAPLLMT